MTTPEVPAEIQLTPVRNVQLLKGLLHDRQCLTRQVMLPTQYALSAQRIDNLRLSWDASQEREPPHPYWDSDIGKWLEAAAYSLQSEPDASLETQVERVIELLEKAQLPDGYLNSYFQQVRPQERWTRLIDDHELYCAGHLIEAAVAHYEATGSRRFLEVACRLADHLVRTFGPGEDQLPGYPGHPEIELALMRLWHATGRPAYRELAAFFVNQRGQQPHYFDRELRPHEPQAPPARYRPDYDWTQAHLPVREQTTAEGHAVRAMYLYCGMADVAIATGDRELLTSCQQLWDNMVHRRMYIHGGIGSCHIGERFSFDYDLPDETAYAETCAGIGLIFFAQRLLHARPAAEYADAIERTFYNNILASISLDGQSYFYSNYLASHPPRHRYETLLKAPVRQRWFGCACCPPNLARLFASLHRYMASTSDNTLWLHHYTASAVTAEVAGESVALSVETDYPWDGDVRIAVTPTTEAAFTIALRLPGWCRTPTLSINGRELPMTTLVRDGYAHIHRRWQAGDTLHLQLPMPVERIEAHPSVRQARGRVALQRGPIVYCLEQEENGGDLHAIVLPTDVAFTAVREPELLGGVVTLSAEALRESTESWQETLYRPIGDSSMVPCRITAIPYFAWANRRPGEMLVWLHSFACV